MLGWSITIAAQTPEERDASSPGDKSAVLAKWQTSWGGIDWLTQLTKEGKATQLTYAGYPNRYTAKAGDVLPVIANGIPDHEDIPVLGEDYCVPAGWKGQIAFNHERIAACPADQILTIDAWDLS
jgi:hypothetical protein